MDEKVEILPDGCPDELPQLAFDVVVFEPDPDAEDVYDRKNSKVVASCEGELAGYLLYGFLADEVWMTKINTIEKFRCRGCARQMYDALVGHYPNRQVKDGATQTSRSAISCSSVGEGRES